jgi:hypothetical protein
LTGAELSSLTQPVPMRAVVQEKLAGMIAEITNGSCWHCKWAAQESRQSGAGAHFDAQAQDEFPIMR